MRKMGGNGVEMTVMTVMVLWSRKDSIMYFSLQNAMESYDDLTE
jgi:hypothetical protein